MQFKVTGILIKREPVALEELLDQFLVPLINKSIKLTGYTTLVHCNAVGAVIIRYSDFHMV